MKNFNYTTQYIQAVTPAPKRSCVDFTALASAYCADDTFKVLIDQIFGHVSRALHFLAVMHAKTRGDTEFFERNRCASLERDDYLQNCAQSAMLKVIRLSCALNTKLKRDDHALFLTRCFSRTDEGYFTLDDARELTLSIAQAYEEATGICIAAKRWLPY